MLQVKGDIIIIERNLHVAILSSSSTASLLEPSRLHWCIAKHRHEKFEEVVLASLTTSSNDTGAKNKCCTVLELVWMDISIKVQWKRI